MLQLSCAATKPGNLYYLFWNFRTFLLTYLYVDLAKVNSCEIFTHLSSENYNLKLPLKKRAQSPLQLHLLANRRPCEME